MCGVYYIVAGVFGLVGRFAEYGPKRVVHATAPWGAPAKIGKLPECSGPDRAEE